MFQMDLAERAAVHLAELRKLGFDVLASDDFEQIEELMQAAGSPFRTPMFDLRRNDFTKGEAFWLFLMRAGKPAGGLAARLVDLKDENFFNYMLRTSAQHYGADAPLAAMAAPLRQRLAGRLVHLGELHLRAEDLAKPELMRAFGHMAVVLSAMSWPEFDWMYSFAPEAHSTLQAAYGFPIVMPHALSWRAPVPYAHESTEAVIYLSKVDFLHLLSLGARRTQDVT